MLASSHVQLGELVRVGSRRGQKSARSDVRDALRAGCQKCTYTYHAELWAYSAIYDHGVRKTIWLTCK